MASAAEAGNRIPEQPAVNGQDSLALMATQPGHAPHVATRTLVEVTSREEHTVYLCGYASRHSFVGSVDDEDGMTEEELAEFVQKNNPDMFRRLLEENNVIQVLHDERLSSDVNEKHLTKNSYDTASIPNQVRGSTQRNDDLHGILLQLKRLVVSCLLNGHVLILQKVALPYPTCCGHPCCRYSHVPMPLATFALELRFEGSSQSKHFCLQCLEHAFGQPEHQYLSSAASTAAFDGMKEDVLQAAQRFAVSTSTSSSPRKTALSPSPSTLKILPMRQKGVVSIENYFEPDFLINHSSNSSQALSLRRQRDTEINKILSHLEKHEQRRQTDVDEPEMSPLLMIPPLQILGEKWYKKQGLVKHDLVKDRKVNGKGDLKSDCSIASTLSSTRSLIARICSCGEPAGVGVIFQCGAEFCPIGSFHLQCTGLSQKPGARLVWYCGNCSDGMEGCLVKAESASDEDNLLVEEGEIEDGYLAELKDEEGIEDDYLSDIDRMSLVSDSRDTLPEEPTTPPKPSEAVNVFTPVNPGRTVGALSPFSIRRTPNFTLDGPDTIDGQPALSLPVGWSEMTFEDLAPFIVAETNVASHRALAVEHLGMLEEWRALCPTSQLLPGQRYGPSTGRYGAQNLAQVVSLSRLLDSVDTQMAGYQGASAVEVPT